MRSAQVLRSSLLTAAAAALMSVVSSCVHWPDQPYAESADVLRTNDRQTLDRDFPEAELTGPVYSKYIESGNRYEVTSRSFLFKDTSGENKRGEIDRTGELTIYPAKLFSRLPKDLEQKFFGEKSTLVPGGKMEGAGWIYSAPDPIYEFRYVSGGIRGVGRIEESGRWLEAIPLR